LYNTWVGGYNDILISTGDELTCSNEIFTDPLMRSVLRQICRSVCERKLDLYQEGPKTLTMTKYLSLLNDMNMYYFRKSWSYRTVGS